MLRNILIVIASVGIVLALITVVISRKSPPVAKIEFPPPLSPYEHFVAGAGLVEAASENVAIGSPITEVVTDVYVKTGDHVTDKTPLFKLDTRLLEKKLLTAKAHLLVKQAAYQKALALPRPEEVPVQEAVVNEKKANFQDYLKRFEIVEKINNPSAVSRDEYFQRKYQAEVAGEELEKAKADLNLLLAGSWIKELEIITAEVKEAKKELEEIAQQIEIATVRAPFEGVVMRVNVRKGEIAPAAELATPLMIFGSLTPLHIRVDIDEADTWRVMKEAPGVAFVRGNSTMKVDLNYLRIEPYLIPKKSLTGDNNERVDTRVLQVIYRFNKGELPIYPGQIMDVFLEARPNL